MATPTTLPAKTPMARPSNTSFAVAQNTSARVPSAIRSTRSVRSAPGSGYNRSSIQPLDAESCQTASSANGTPSPSVSSRSAPPTVRSNGIGLCGTCATNQFTPLAVTLRTLDHCGHDARTGIEPTTSFADTARALPRRAGTSGHRAPRGYAVLEGHGSVEQNSSRSRRHHDPRDLRAAPPRRGCASPSPQWDGPRPTASGATTRPA